MAITTTFLEPGSAATQDLSFWPSLTTGGTGSITSDGTVTYSSGRSIKIATGGTGGSSNILIAPSGILNATGSQISFYFKTDTIAPSGNVSRILALVVNNSSGLCVDFTINNAGTNHLAVRNSSTTLIATGTTTFANNTWYRISVSFYITDGTHYSIKAYVNGVLDLTGDNTSGVTLFNTGVNCFYIRSQNATANANQWYDDIYVATGGASSSSQPDTGNILVTAKRPYANGTTNGFSTNGSASGYGSGNAEYVNYRPSGATATTPYVSKVGAGAAVTEEYNIEGLSIGDVNLTGATIVDYMGWLYASSLASETDSMILNGSTYNISVTSTNTMFTQAAGSASYPAGTGSDIGIITTNALTTTSLYSAGIIVAYNANTSSTVLLPPQGTVTQLNNGNTNMEILI